MTSENLMTVPADTVEPTSVATLRMLIGAVVRTKVGRLHHPAGTKAVVVSTRDEGRFQLELLVPGFPIKFWAGTGEVEILNAPRQDWWALLESPDA
jgi:hypothetical protein